MHILHLCLCFPFPACGKNAEPAGVQSVAAQCKRGFKSITLCNLPSPSWYDMHTGRPDIILHLSVPGDLGNSSEVPHIETPRISCSNTPQCIIPVTRTTIATSRQPMRVSCQESVPLDILAAAYCGRSFAASESCRSCQTWRV